MLLQGAMVSTLQKGAAAAFVTQASLGAAAHKAGRHSVTDTGACAASGVVCEQQQQQQVPDSTPAMMIQMHAAFAMS